MKRSNGIALIQILIIVSVLTIIAIYFTKTAQMQVKMATWSNDKAQAEVNLRSDKAELLFELLTQKKLNVESDNASITANKWNFYSEPFSISSQVIIQMQDLAGLINIHYPERLALKQLLVYGGMQEIDAVHWVESLLDYQDGDKLERQNGNENGFINGKIRNGNIPDISEVKHFGLPPSITGLLLSNTTMYRIGYFNPATSSIELLSSLSGNNNATQAVMMRRETPFDPVKFAEIIGIEQSDDLFFYPSNNLAIDFVSTVGYASISRKIVVKLNQYAAQHQLPVTQLAIIE